MGQCRAARPVPEARQIPAGLVRASALHPANSHICEQHFPEGPGRLPASAPKAPPGIPMKMISLMVPLSALALLPAAAMAQTAPAAQQASKAAAKPAAKNTTTPKKPLARSAVKAVEEQTPIDEDSDVTLSEADLAVAQRVHMGAIACELGASVDITPSKRPGFFVLQLKNTRNTRFFMHPVESRTGAIRLEDPKRGAMWLQLGNKSMLMSQKLGVRLADECKSADQVTVAEEMKRNPPRSILEPLDAPAGGAAAPTR